MKIAVASLVSQERKNAWPAPGKIPMISATGREAEQHERDDLGEDHGQREEAEQQHGAERAEQHDHGERQALVGAAGLLGVDRGRVGLVDLVAAELRRVDQRGLALAERVVLGLALLRARALREVAGRRSRRGRPCPA